MQLACKLFVNKQKKEKIDNMKNSNIAIFLYLSFPRLNQCVQHTNFCIECTYCRDRPKPVFLVLAIAKSGAVTEVQLWP